ncbi:hypothetical protein TTHT_0233 [Thermotomaculum hydrothermale]|uniref:Roadblock/LC7 family protein n=1 Tax=Thermotomaculum hydrothermale TaxID=981385 RepID=A0A7R6PSK5_9BACT|nr:hypothetical protein [Thermotomaculum hydrothermale]BBB31857.1 hypothetical protein TTHT_0233 [Thermotomaculum hydrothermale]
MAFKQLISDLNVKSILVFDSQGLLIYSSEAIYDYIHEPEMLAVELLDFVNSLQPLPLFFPDHYIIKADGLNFFVKKHQDFYVVLLADDSRLLKANLDFIKVYNRVIKTLL